MFLDNRTGLDARLGRGLLFDGIAAFSVGIQVWYAIEEGRLRRVPAPEGLALEPPDVRGALLWKGTTVSVFGHVPCPTRSPYLTSVTLQVGDTTRRLAVFGPRRWESRFRGLSASDPEPFEPLPLSWNLAFGGTDHRPPGWDHASRLPHPGGPVPYVLNPSGQGFIYDVEQAEGRSLPQIELPGALVRDPGDRPVPAGFAPCPNLMALRAAAIVGEGLSLQSASMREELDKHLDLQHHVAPSCVFPSLAVDERITVLGLGTRPVVVVPRCPSSLRLPGRSARCRLRDVHIDADHAVARLTWTFGRRFDREAPPRRLTLEMAA